MNNKSRITLYLVAGIYIIYLGINLVKGYINGEGGNPTVSLIGGIVFLAVGVWMFVSSIRKMVCAFKEAQNEEVEEQDAPEVVETESEEDK